MFQNSVFDMRVDEELTYLGTSRKTILMVMNELYDLCIATDLSLEIEDLLNAIKNTPDTYWKDDMATLYLFWAKEACQNTNCLHLYYQAVKQVRILLRIFLRSPVDNTRQPYPSNTTLNVDELRAQHHERKRGNSFSDEDDLPPPLDDDLLLEDPPKTSDANELSSGAGKRMKKEG